MRLLGILFTTCLLIGVGPTMTEALEVTDFRLLNRERGVALYELDGTYVHVVYPREGGRVELLAERVGASTFARRTAPEWYAAWQEAIGPGAFSVVNAQFFDMRQPGEAPLAFAAKIAGEVLPGYGDTQEFKQQKRVVFFEERRTRVVPLGADRIRLLERASAPNAIVGLAPDAAKSAQAALGRTFIGARRNGVAIVAVSPGASQAHMADVLRTFGVRDRDVVMLDGGGSTQLVNRGWLHVPLGRDPEQLRAIPMALGIRVAGRRGLAE